MDSYGWFIPGECFDRCSLGSGLWTTIQSMTTIRLLVEYPNAHMSAYVEMLVLLHVDDQPYKAGVSVVQSYSLDNSSQPCLVQRRDSFGMIDAIPSCLT